MSAQTLDTMQSGLMLIGASNSPELENVLVQFPTPFSTVPVVLAGTLQGTFGTYNPPFPDTYAVTLTEVTESEFRVNVTRVDADLGWGEALQLSWVAIPT